MAGAEPGMILHNAYGYGLFTGGLGLHAGGERLGMTVVPISGGLTERQLMLITDLRPEVICCTPSYALTLAQAFAERGVEADRLSLRVALLGAEPWTEAMRHVIDAGLGVMSTNIYGLSEVIGPGVSCECVDERAGLRTEPLLKPPAGVTVGDEADVVAVRLVSDGEPSAGGLGAYGVLAGVAEGEQCMGELVRPQHG